MNKKLFRSTTDRVIGGVLGGIAEYLNISSSLLRILFVVIAIFGDVAFLLSVLYVLGAIFIPLSSVSFRGYEPNNAGINNKTDFSESSSGYKNRVTVGIALIVLGLFFFMNMIFSISKEYILAIVLILVGIYVIFKSDKGVS